jgi:hypothetical protein
MKTAIININLEYLYDESHDDSWIMRDLMNMELPSNYVEDSFEIVKIIKEASDDNS